MRTMHVSAALLMWAAMSAPAWAQTQHEQWAGWDSGRADRLADQSVRSDGRAVGTIAAQPLRGSVDDVLHARVREARTHPSRSTAVASRYPAAPAARHRDDRVAVNVGYRNDDAHASFGVGVSAPSVHRSGYVSQRHHAHPGATIVHQHYRPVPRPLHIHPHPHAPRPALIYYRPACPPPVVYRSYPYCPPKSGFRFSFTYRN